MNILLTYYSETGNTKKLSEQIKDVLEKRRLTFDYIDIKKFDLNRVNQYDVFLIGSPCHSNDLVPRVKKLLTSISRLNNKKVFLFVTHSSDPAGKYYDRWASGCEGTFKKIVSKDKILGYYHCQGKPNFNAGLFIKYVVFRKDKTGWLERKTDMMSRPNAKEFSEIRQIIDEMVSKSFKVNQ